MIDQSPAIHLVILEAEEPDYLRQVAESIQEQFDLDVTVGKPLGLPTYALDPVRKQYNSNLILKRLAETCPPHAVKVLGLTPVDLFSPIFTYVFGEALFQGKSAVISAFRLRGVPDAKAALGCPPLMNRMEKEAVHELGHTFGLRHCLDPDCVMNYSSGVQCADRKFPFFCPACRELLLWSLKKSMRE